METVSPNRRLVVNQFLTWWGLYFLFLISVLFVHFWLNGQECSFHDIIASIGCTGLASLMAISHYYLLYNKYLTKRNYLVYFALTICFIGLFIFLDAVLFYSQVGRLRFFSVTAGRMFITLLSRVMILYAPVALVYTLVHHFRDKRKEPKIS